MEKNKQQVSEIIQNNWFLFKLCWNAAPVYLVMYIGEMIRNQSVIFLEFTVALNYVLECAEFGRSFHPVAVMLLSLLTFVMLGLVYNAVLFQKVELKGKPKICQAVKKMLYQKAKEIDIECYDNPGFYNDYVLTVFEVEKLVERMLNMVKDLFGSLTAVLLAGTFIVSNDPFSFIFVAVSSILSFLVSKALVRVNFQNRKEKIVDERKRNYIQRAFYLNEYAKELRMSPNIRGKLFHQFQRANDGILQTEKKYAKKRFWYGYIKHYLLGDFVIDVLYMVYLVYMAVVHHSISCSNVAVLRSTAGRTKNQMRVLSDIFSQMQEISLYVTKIRHFMQTPVKVTNTEQKDMPVDITEIELKDVSFSYHNQDAPVIKNISMTITAKSRIAVVGYNGAGKTTLTKLILRLYDPDEGEILLNGVNIKEYDLQAYRKRISTVFQDFKIFAATAKENVLMDFAYTGTDEAVTKALKRSGLDPRDLPNGLQTNLTTEFHKEGINSSGGEGQKVALSRAFYADADFMILDEPTSTLDPIAEYHLNRSMLVAAENKSVIFISHRLSTTLIADVVYMLEKGCIIERGSHEELLVQNGKYAEMWRTQAGQYLE